MNAAERSAAIAKVLDALTDEELLDLQREVSRRAHVVRMGDPEFRRCWEAGVAANIAKQRVRRHEIAPGAGRA